jgi:hypothetical protein
MLSTILMVFALVFFVLDTAGVPSSPPFNLLAAGLASWALSILVGGANLHF